MGNYKLSAQAEADLIRIHQWGIRRFGEHQGDAYYLQLIDQCALIAQNPLLYPSAEDIRPGYRRSVCGVDTIYYRILEETVEIMAIVGRQDTQSWL